MARLLLTGLPIWMALASVFWALIGSKVLKCVSGSAVERIGVLGLGHRDAGQRLDQAQVLHHPEALAQGADVTQVAARDDDPSPALPSRIAAPTRW